MSIEVDKICKNCKFSSAVDEEVITISQRIAQIKNDKTIVNKVKKEIIANEKLFDKKIFAIEGIGDGSKFMSCSNLEHLKDLSGQEEYVCALHKYYFSCPHYEAGEK